MGVAALAMVGTPPGRTQGLGLITESLPGICPWIAAASRASTWGHACRLRWPAGFGGSWTVSGANGADDGLPRTRRHGPGHEPRRHGVRLVMAVTLSRPSDKALSVASLTSRGCGFRGGFRRRWPPAPWP